MISQRDRGSMMRIVFINQLHPDTGLIGSVRLSRFAEELAIRGHQILMVCESSGAGECVEELGRRLSSHDWTTPLIVAVGSAPDRISQLRRDRLPALARRIGTLWDLVVRGGVLWRWRREIRKFHALIKEQFAPQLCYATFGNIDTLAAARELAEFCNVPWVMDIKDPATSFLPRSLRPLLTGRLRGASAVTLNSDYQRDHNPGWVRSDALTLYSGVETSQVPLASFDPTSFNLVGSVYDERHVATLLKGFREANSGTKRGLRLRYFGLNVDAMARVAAELGGVDGLEVIGMVDRQLLLISCAESAASVYIGSSATFHHKLLELAAVGRPLIVCPAESEEARELAEMYGLTLFQANSVEDLVPCFLRATEIPTRNMLKLRTQLSWSAVSGQLEHCFVSVLGLQNRSAK